MLQTLLEQCQARVKTAANAADALRLIDAFEPDVVVSDIGMPEVDGYRFIEQRAPDRRPRVDARRRSP